MILENLTYLIAGILALLIVTASVWLTGLAVTKIFKFVDEGAGINFLRGWFIICAVGVLGTLSWGLGKGLLGGFN